MENNNQGQTVSQQTLKLAMTSMMFCFFTMGFVDLVGTASNYVKQDLNLSDTVANFLPSLVFFWFLIFSVPTGVLMNKIGRKKTVMLSLIVTVVSLLLPIFSENFVVMLVSFSLLGIGNTLMQTSLNPLVSMYVKDHLASTLTFGQFIKAIASFLAPIIASWGAAATIPSLGLGWRVLFPIYMIVGDVTISTRSSSLPILTCCFASSASCATSVSMSVRTRRLRNFSSSMRDWHSTMPPGLQASTSSSVPSGA